MAGKTDGYTGEDGRMVYPNQCVECPNCHSIYTKIFEFFWSIVWICTSCNQRFYRK
jgi:ribosomal protein L37AE/L43A